MESVLSISLSSLFGITLSAFQFNFRTRKMVQTLLSSHQAVNAKWRLLNTIGCMVESKVLEAVVTWVHAGNKAGMEWTFSAPVQLLETGCLLGNLPIAEELIEFRQWVMQPYIRWVLMYSSSRVPAASYFHANFSEHI